jgi:L-threonylcarbamoyladenylate synthase
MLTILSTASPDAVRQAAAALRAGEVVAIPTDTVYGLAASLEHPPAIDRLYALKERPSAKAIPVLISDLDSLDLVAATMPPLARSLAARFWPGALTLVIPALPELPLAITSADERGTRTVAVRMPDHEAARRVIALAGGALAVTSANRSGDDPALDAAAVARLGPAAPTLILDGGAAPGGVASTIVLATGATPIVLREGAIPSAELIASI